MIPHERRHISHNPAAGLVCGTINRRLFSNFSVKTLVFKK